MLNIIIIVKRNREYGGIERERERERERRDIYGGRKCVKEGKFLIHVDQFFVV